MLVRKLFRTALLYKSQFLSMIIMIAIGMGVFLGFNIEWRSIEYDTEKFMKETKYADYRIYSDTGFSKSDIEKISKIEGVDAATRYFTFNADIKGKDKKLGINVSEDGNVSTMLITEGEAYDENLRGIWISDKFAQVNNIKTGDEITIVYSSIEITCQVKGLAKSSENMISVADENQLLPDYEKFGFAYITPKVLEEVMREVFYPQINVISDMEKTEFEKAVKEATDMTFLVMSKEEHHCYAGVQGEIEEGKTMALVLPVLFVAIAVLTMITTMHRIASNEKVQIGTLKALGFKDKKIIMHYTLYGFFIGVTGMIFATCLGYFMASFIISEDGMMSTYLDILSWELVMPKYCIPVVIFVLILLTFISYMSVKNMLKGTAADALRPYTPKPVKKSIVEKFTICKKFSFGVKWNLRDVLRHKPRSAMTLLGVCGCMMILVAGLGMKDTMMYFLDTLDKDVSNYHTKISISENASSDKVKEAAKEVSGDWMATVGINYNSEAVTLEIYDINNESIRFFDEDDNRVIIEDGGVYLCQRLKGTLNVGDMIEFSPYESDKTYKVKVLGFVRSITTKCMIMTDEYADSLQMDYGISCIYTNAYIDEIEENEIISSMQDKETIMESYDTFMELMNMMVVMLIIAAVILGIVVLYNLGIMSYVERYTELATLKVLGFKDKQIGSLLIMQNSWLTIIGMVLGIVLGQVALKVLILALASEYEMNTKVYLSTYMISVALTYGVSLFVSFMIAGKNKKIDMVAALKNTE